jgi:hypothetical protein
MLKRLSVFWLMIQKLTKFYVGILLKSCSKIAWMDISFECSLRLVSQLFNILVIKVQQQRALNFYVKSQSYD